MINFIQLYSFVLDSISKFFFCRQSGTRFIKEKCVLEDYVSYFLSPFVDLFHVFLRMKIKSKVLFERLLNDTRNMKPTAANILNMT